MTAEQHSAQASTLDVSAMIPESCHGCSRLFFELRLQRELVAYGNKSASEAVGACQRIAEAATARCFIGYRSWDEAGTGVPRCGRDVALLPPTEQPIL